MTASASSSDLRRGIAGNHGRDGSSMRHEVHALSRHFLDVRVRGVLGQHEATLELTLGSDTGDTGRIRVHGRPLEHEVQGARRTATGGTGRDLERRPLAERASGTVVSPDSGAAIARSCSEKGVRDIGRTVILLDGEIASCDSHGELSKDGVYPGG